MKIMLFLNGVLALLFWTMRLGLACVIIWLMIQLYTGEVTSVSIGSFFNSLYHSTVK
jgi:hypothetical protein